MACFFFLKLSTRNTSNTTPRKGGCELQTCGLHLDPTCVSVAHSIF